jgi:hypothetical protein
MNPLIMGILQQQSNLAVWRNIVSYWKLDDNAASATVIDSANGRNGYLCKAIGGITNRNTSTATTTGKIGNGFTFLTTGSYDRQVGVRVNDNDAFTFGNGTADTPFSGSCWVNLAGYGYPSGADTLTFLLSKRYTVTDGLEWQFALRDSGVAASPRYKVSIALFSAKNSTNFINYLYDLGGTILSAWHHLTFTYNGSAPADGAVKIYMDGVLLSLISKTETGTYVAMNNTTSELGVGCWASLNNENNFSVNGVIDEVGLWSRELSLAEAKLLYNLGNGFRYYK